MALLLAGAAVGTSALHLRINRVEAQLMSYELYRLPISAAVCRCLASAVFVLVATSAQALNPESPEVRKLIDKGIAYLNDKTHEELGGKCLIGLAFVKDDQPDHSTVAEALQACRKAKADVDAGDVYSNGIALIFLCELDAKRYRDLIDFFFDALKRRQKQHGAWGYNASPMGDTSQTQYGTLGLWEAYQNRVKVSPDSVSRCLDWLVKTQDPSGAWGYQGKLPKSDGEKVKQSRTRPTMAAAGLSSLLVCADLFGMLSPNADIDSELAYAKPEGFREASRGGAGRPRPLDATGVDRERVFAALKAGQAWFQDNFTIKVQSWTMYYLYSMERYKSFEELLSTEVEESPTWYVEGYKHLSSVQAEDGSWSNGHAGPAIDTAFAVLFLLRSTQKSLRRGFGEGVMVSGRGAPVELARKKGLNPGGLLAKEASTKVSDMLALLDDGRAQELDAIAADPTAFVGGPVDEKTARRLKQVVRGGEPAARFLAVRSLAKTGKLDYAPTLLYALTDPDQRVTLEARDGLRLLSRRFEGYELPDNYTERQRYEALDSWKRWYLTLRPDAVLDL